MNDLLLFTLAGLVTGSVYGLAGMGLVLTYTTSGLFNFAHGAIAAVGAFAFYSLEQQVGLPWPVAAFLTLFVVAPVLGLLLERMAAGLATVRPAMKIVGTVGLLLFLVGALQLLYGSTQRDFPPFLPTGSFEVAGLFVTADQAITAGLSAAIAAGLAFLLRRTQTGRAMRAVVADPALLSLTGQNPSRVRRTAWILGAQLACLSGVLIATTLGLDALLLTLLVVSAFGAAAVGRFSSLPMTFAGGLLVGVVEAQLRNLTTGNVSLSTLPAATPFLVLLAVLVLTPTGRLSEATGRTRSAAVATTKVPPQVAALGGAALLAALVVAPFLVGSRLSSWTQALAFVPIFLSLGLLVWTSGQVSLAHASFVALGTSTLAHFTSDLGLPWVLALVLAGLAVVPVGVAVAIPAIRVSGLFLALATFGFGVLMEVLVYGRSFAYGRLGQVEIPRPAGFEGGKAYYYLVLVIAMVACGLVAVLQRSRVGRLLRALADSPTALVTYGAEINRLRVAVFGVSAFLAGIGGGLLGGVTGSVSASGFTSFTSLTWLAVLALIGTRCGALPALGAAAALVLAPSYLSGDPAIFTLVFGASALVAAIRSDSETAPGAPSLRTAERFLTPGPVQARSKVAA